MLESEEGVGVPLARYDPLDDLPGLQGVVTDSGIEVEYGFTGPAVFLEPYFLRRRSDERSELEYGRNGVYKKVTRRWSERSRASPPIYSPY